MAKKTEARHQIGALPVRERDGTTEVCLVTTRETRRWTVPKGWPMRGHKDWDAARIEAEEEAGVSGTVARKPIGSYLYWKRRIEKFDLVRVNVYRLDVLRHLAAWKEAAERRVEWFPAEVAAEMVDEPGLAALISAFADEAADGGQDPA